MHLLVLVVVDPEGGVQAELVPLHEGSEVGGDRPEDGGGVVEVQHWSLLISIINLPSPHGLNSSYIAQRGIFVACLPRISHQEGQLQLTQARHPKSHFWEKSETAEYAFKLSILKITI